jgi:hypothetical protein
MSSYEWIIYERRGVWAAGLRMAIARRGPGTTGTPRIYEVRSLEGLNERLTAKPDSLALVELHPGNTTQVLSWLARLPTFHCQARFVALVDRSLASPDEANLASPASHSSRVANVLLEAGALEIVFSPRQLPRILATAIKHAELWESRRQTTRLHQSLTDWAWSLLPWQTE